MYHPEKKAIKTRLCESNNFLSPKMWQLAWNESQTSRQPGNPGTVATQAGEMVSSHIGLSHCVENMVMVSLWQHVEYNTHHNRIYLLRMKVIIFSKEKHFCPNQPHYLPCHTSSGVHWALLDIGALSGGPWIFHIKFYPGLRKNKSVREPKNCAWENAEMSVI